MVMPHMHKASWDTLEMIMEHLAQDYPKLFSLTRAGDQWLWRNRALGIEQAFRFGNAGTLPCEPLEYIMRQTQGDIALLDQRDATAHGSVHHRRCHATGPHRVVERRVSRHRRCMAHDMGIFDRALIEQRDIALRLAA